MDRRSWTVANDMQREIRDWAEHERLANSVREQAGQHPAHNGRLWVLVFLLATASVILLAVLLYVVVPASAASLPLDLKGQGAAVSPLEIRHTGVQLARFWRMNATDDPRKPEDFRPYPNLLLQSDIVDLPDRVGIMRRLCRAY